MLFLFCVPFIASAETVIRSGENTTLSVDQTVAGDYYVSSGPFGHTTISGIVNEDVYAIGATLTANGTIGKDLSILAATAQVHGNVADDVRIIAGDVTIAEHIGGDVFVIAGSLKVLSNAVIDGSIFFFGGTAEINGVVKGSVMGTSERIRIDAEVTEHVDIKTATELTLGEKANITGFVRHESPRALVRAQNAVVQGEITHSTPKTLNTDTQERVKTALIPLFVTLFAALCAFLFMRTQVQAIAHLVHKAPRKVSVLGLLTLLVIPFLVLILCITVLGLLIGVLLGTFLLFVCIAGVILSGCVFGSYLAKMFTNHPQVTLPWILAGTTSLHVLLLIPIVGPVLVFGAFAVTVGGFILFIYSRV